MALLKRVAYHHYRATNLPHANRIPRRRDRSKPTLDMCVTTDWAHQKAWSHPVEVTLYFSGFVQSFFLVLFAGMWALSAANDIIVNISFEGSGSGGVRLAWDQMSSGGKVSICTSCINSMP